MKNIEYPMLNVEVELKTGGVKIRIEAGGTKAESSRDSKEPGI